MKIDKFSEMLEEIQRERGINKEALLEAIRVSLLSAAKKIFKGEEEENLEVRISEDGLVTIIHKKDDKEEDVTPKDFGRLAAQTAKQVIIQRIREAEKEEVFEEFTHKQGELITGVVQRKEYGGYLINLGRVETVLPVSEQIPGEILQELPEGTFTIPEDFQGLEDRLDNLLKLCGLSKKKKQLGFLALHTDGQGSYWFRGTRNYITALNESLYSLETLADEQKHGSSGAVNKVYRELARELEAL